ncbi:MAG: DNA polymerase I [Firmicutes bacterium]|nr:DNA polymerase I [Bacillota bacterium]
MNKAAETFVLIDGNSLVNRAFYALPPLTNASGTPTQAVYGFANMLVKAITDFSPKYLAVAFDLPQPTFRHKKYEGYKATRKKMPDELAVQLPLLKEMLHIMGVKILELAGFEADDIIGAAAKCDPTRRVYIITGDRDALQLIDDNVRVVLTKRGLSETVVYDEARLKQDYSLTPAQIIDYKALCGDSSDNIPGVAGVGDKTALSLINSYNSLNGVYENLHQITGKLKDKLFEGRQSAYLSYELAQIDTAAPVDCTPCDCAYPYPFNSAVKRFFIDNGFKTLVKRGELFIDADGADSTAEIIQKYSPAAVISVNTAAQLADALNVIQKTAAICFSEKTLHIAAEPHTEYAVNLAQTLIDEGISYAHAADALKPVLENPEILKIVHGAKTLKKQLAAQHSTLVNYFDTKVAQYLVDMSVPYETPAQLCAAHGASETAPAAGLLHIKDVLSGALSALNMTGLYTEIELPLTDILFRMEREGFKVDVDKLAKLGTDFSARAHALSERIQQAAAQTFNVNSPKQLGKVLFEDLKIPYPKKSGTYSTAAEILEQIEDGYPIVKDVLAYRFLTKLNGTYVEGLLRAADSRGVVHTDFKQTLTTTGRLSSVEPNLQNIPVREEEGRLLRAAFIPKSTQNVLISADYSQIELRLLAHLSADSGLIEAYQNGEDIHAATAARVFGVPLSDITPAMRRDAKAVNFGIIYGISDFGLAKNLGVSRYTAKDYISRYFQRFAGVKEYLDASVALAKKRGYAETMFGRIRKIPELLSPNFNLRAFGERVAMNMPLQGSAADIIKIAMVKVFHALKNKKSKLILQVHDELIIDAFGEEAEEVAALLKTCMESAAQLKVPLVADLGTGKTWYECK